VIGVPLHELGEEVAAAVVPKPDADVTAEELRARVAVRPIDSDDKPLLATSFARVSEESRYRRFFSPKSELSAAELEYCVDVDHMDREAILALALLEGAGTIRCEVDARVVEILVELPPKRGSGKRLTHVLRAAAAGSVVPARTAGSSPDRCYGAQKGHLWGRRTIAIPGVRSWVRLCSAGRTPRSVSKSASEICFVSRAGRMMARWTMSRSRSMITM